MARYWIVVESSFFDCHNCQLLAFQVVEIARHARVLSEADKDMVGSHTAGAETWKPLIDESVCRLLAKSCQYGASGFSYDDQWRRHCDLASVCFVGD
jgi:hypothetical protein